MNGGNEAHARVLINAQLKDPSWDIQDPNSVRYEVPLKDGKFADYVLCDRHGRSLAVIEAKRFSTNPAEAEDQARNYAQQLGVPFKTKALPHTERFFFRGIGRLRDGTRPPLHP